MNDLIRETYSVLLRATKVIENIQETKRRCVEREREALDIQQEALTKLLMLSKHLT